MIHYLRHILYKILTHIRFVVLSINYRYLIRRIKRKIKKGNTIKIGFLGFLDGPSCDVFSSLYFEFAKDNRFLCEAVTVPYSHDSEESMIQKLDVSERYLESIGIVPLSGYDSEKKSFVDYSGRFDIVFFEIEYDWVPSCFKVSNFRSALSFVVPYGQYLADNISQHMSYSMMSEVFNIFPTSRSVGKMMKKYSQVKGHNILDVYLGNPKIDRFFCDKQAYSDVFVKAKPGQKRIIWAPHHTWAQYSNFLEYSEFFLELAKNHKDLFIAIKPHPALRDSLRFVNDWSEDEISEYFNRWRIGENTDLFEGAWFDLFMSSDAMIMDSIGFMLEYSLTGKPSCVLYREGDDGQRVMKFSESGEQIFQLLYHAKSENEIVNFVKMICEGIDYRKTERLTYINKDYLPPYGKKGSANIYDYVVRLFS